MQYSFLFSTVYKL